MPTPDPAVETVIDDEVLRERIRRLVPAKSESVWERRLKHPATLLFFGFLLTTIAGGAITSLYQKQAAEAARKSAMIEARRAAAMTTFAEVGRLMDRRLFWGSQYYDALSTDTTSARRNALAAKFDSTIWAWRESYNTNVAAVCRYFGPALARTLTDSISVGFSLLGKGIRDYGVSPRLAPRDLFPLYESLRKSILQFDLTMVEMVRDGSAGDVAGGSCRDTDPKDTVSTRRGR